MNDLDRRVLMLRDMLVYVHQHIESLASAVMEQPLHQQFRANAARLGDACETQAEIFRYLATLGVREDIPN